MGVCVVCVQQSRLRGVHGTGHRGEGMRSWIPSHLTLEGKSSNKICSYSILSTLNYSRVLHSDSKDRVEGKSCLSEYLVMSRVLGTGIEAFTGARTGVTRSTWLQIETGGN